jgi:hypothetical protein
MNDLFGQQDRYCKKYSPGTIIVESLKFFRDNAIQNKSSMLKVTSNESVLYLMKLTVLKRVIHHHRQFKYLGLNIIKHLPSLVEKVDQQEQNIHL